MDAFRKVTHFKLCYGSHIYYNAVPVKQVPGFVYGQEGCHWLPRKSPDQAHEGAVADAPDGCGGQWTGARAATNYPVPAIAEGTTGYKANGKTDRCGLHREHPTAVPSGTPSFLRIEDMRHQLVRPL
jgi:hypothetical protein